MLLAICSIDSCGPSWIRPSDIAVRPTRWPKPRPAASSKTGARYRPAAAEIAPTATPPTTGAIPCASRIRSARACVSSPYSSISCLKRNDSADSSSADISLMPSAISFCIAPSDIPASDALRYWIPLPIAPARIIIAPGTSVASREGVCSITLYATASATSRGLPRQIVLSGSRVSSSRPTMSMTSGFIRA